MPIVPINYFAVLVAAIVNMVLGIIWFGPLFGKQWIKMSKFSQKDMVKAKKKGMSAQYGLMFVGSLVMSYVLAHSLIFASTYLHLFGLAGGLMSGFWSWLGFVAPVTLGSVLWEGKPWKLWLLNNGYYLFSLILMGSVLAFL